MHHVLVSGVKLEKINGNETPINVQLFESKLMIINPWYYWHKWVVKIKCEHILPNDTHCRSYGYNCLCVNVITSEKRDLTIKIQSMDGVHVKSIALLLESSWLLLACKRPLSPRNRRILWGQWINDNIPDPI